MHTNGFESQGGRCIAVSLRVIKENGFFRTDSKALFGIAENACIRFHASGLVAALYSVKIEVYILPFLREIAGNAVGPHDGICV